MSIILIALLLMRSDLLSAALNTNYVNVQPNIAGASCLQGYLEIGVLQKNSSGTGTILYVVEDTERSKVQNQFKAVCEANNSSGIDVQEIKNGRHPSGAASGNSVCCLKEDAICGSVDAYMLNDYWITQGDICPPGSSKKTGKEQFANITLCCEDSASHAKCPNGDSASTKACTSIDDCNLDEEIVKGAHSCLKTIPGGAKRCCSSAKKCPGGLSAHPDKDLNGDASNCNLANKTHFYDVVGGCCPRLVHRFQDWNLNPFAANDGSVTACTDNKGCGEGMFCDQAQHSQLGNIKTNKTYCYRDPTFIGKVVKATVGLKQCLSHTDCDERDGEFCALNGLLADIAFTKYKESVGMQPDNKKNPAGVCFKVDKCPSEPRDPELKGTIKGLYDHGYPVAAKATSGEFVNDIFAVQYYTWTSDRNEYKNKTSEEFVMSCRYVQKNATEYCAAEKATPAFRRTTTGAKLSVGCSSDAVCELLADNRGLTSHGKCVKEKTTNGTGLCCTVPKCPDTNILLSSERLCTNNDDCITEKKGGGICTPDRASGKSHCCPKMIGGKTQFHYVTGIECTDVEDCSTSERLKMNQVGLYCRPANDGGKGNCSVIGDAEEKDKASASDTTCVTNKECEKIKGTDYNAICVMNVGARKCFNNPFKPIIHTASIINDKWFIGAIGCFIASVVFGLIATCFFLKYRSRHFCDRRKKKNNKKDKKKGGSSKTTSSKTGATSEKTGATGADKTEATGAEQSGTTAGGGATGATGATGGATGATTGGEKSGTTAGGTNGATTGGEQSKAESVQQ